MDARLKMSEEKPSKKRTRAAAGLTAQPKSKAETTPAPKPRDLVVARYTAYKWTITPAPRNTVNDLIAHKNNVFHFIKIAGRVDTPIDGSPASLSKNTFIQNAFANGARAVFAEIAADTSARVILIDANTGVKIKLRE